MLWSTLLSVAYQQPRRSLYVVFQSPPPAGFLFLWSLDLEYSLYYNKSMIFANFRRAAEKFVNRHAVFAVLFAIFTVVAVTAFDGTIVSAACDVSNPSVSSGADCARGNGQPSQLVGDGGVFNRITSILLFVVGAVAVVMLIFGGIRYIVSGGDQANVTAAKNTILYAIIGIIIALLAYAAVKFVTTSLLSGMT